MAEDSAPVGGPKGMVLELTETSVRLIDGIKVDITNKLTGGGMGRRQAARHRFSCDCWQAFSREEAHQPHQPREVFSPQHQPFPRGRYLHERAV